MKANAITIKANISKERQQVWTYYTEPAHITQWNFATDEWCCPNAENDMTIGGQYKARMEAKDSSFGFDFIAIYQEISPEVSFTYQMEDGREVKVRFEDTNQDTNVTIIFEPEDQNSLDLQKNGWQAILNNFKKYAESI